MNKGINQTELLRETRKLIKYLTDQEYFLDNYIITSRRSNDDLMAFTCSLYDYLIDNANTYLDRIRNDMNNLTIDIYKELTYPGCIIYKLDDSPKLKKVFPENSDILMSVFEVEILDVEDDDSCPTVIRFIMDSNNELYDVMTRIGNYYVTISSYFSNYRKISKKIGDLRKQLNVLLLGKEYDLKQNNRLMGVIDLYQKLINIVNDYGKEVK